MLKLSNICTKINQSLLNKLVNSFIKRTLTKKKVSDLYKIDT